MEANRVTAAIFGLIYRLLALAALAIGIQRAMWEPYNMISLMFELHTTSYSFVEAFRVCWPSTIMDFTFILIGGLALYQAPRILKVLYRE